MIRLPDDPRDVFSPEQRADLEHNLKEILAGESLNKGLIAVAIAFGEARIFIEHRHELKSLNDADREHFAAVLHHASALQALLSERRPTRHLSSRLWAPFDEELSRLTLRFRTGLAAIAQSAAQHVWGTQLATGPGRTPEVWRDRLIATVYHVYPPGTAKKAQGSHFEDTVDLLLRMLGQPVSDVHSVVLGALKRCPDPPIRVA
jgi:hypothetical protein